MRAARGWSRGSHPSRRMAAASACRTPAEDCTDSGRPVASARTYRGPRLLKRHRPEPRRVRICLRRRTVAHGWAGLSVAGSAIYGPRYTGRSFTAQLFIDRALQEELFKDASIDRHKLFIDAAICRQLCIGCVICSRAISQRALFHIARGLGLRTELTDCMSSTAHWDGHASAQSMCPFGSMCA